MATSERDKEYFARIGAIKAALHEEAARAHLGGSIDERFARSWSLYVAHRHQVDTSNRDDDPSPFYERARRLGLYLE